MKYACIVIVALTLSLSACVTTKGTKATARGNAGSIASLKEKTSTLTGQSDLLDTRLKELEKNIASLEVKLRTLEAKTGENREISALEDMVIEIDQRLTDIETGQSPIQTSTSISMSKDMYMDMDTVSIKVLSGTGNMGAARVLSMKLQKAGYKVNRVDIAQSRFRKNTVFFGEGFDDVAVEVAGYLGLSTSIKPLTWGSSFNIIAVTVE